MSYSIDQLISLKAHAVTPRCVRRAIFCLHLWKPSSVKPHSFTTAVHNHRISYHHVQAVNIINTGVSILRECLCVIVVVRAALSILTTAMEIVRVVMVLLSSHSTVTSHVNAGGSYLASEDDFLNPDTIQCSWLMDNSILPTHIHDQLSYVSSNSAIFLHPANKPDIQLQHMHTTLISDERISGVTCTSTAHIHTFSHAPIGNSASRQPYIRDRLLKRATLSKINTRAPPSAVKCALLNARSVCNKQETLQAFLYSNNVDIAAVTETWLTNDDTFNQCIMNAICGCDFVSMNSPRKDGKKGGGISLIYRKDFDVKMVSFDMIVTSFEFVILHITIKSVSFYYLIIYRPPNTSISSFISEFSDVLLLTSKYDRLIILGDFNINVNSHSQNTRDFVQVTQVFDLNQHVRFPTHIAGNTIDLVFSRPHTLIANCRVDPGISDHSSIIFLVEFPFSGRSFTTQTKQHRSYRDFNLLNFMQDLHTTVTMPILWAASAFNPPVADLVGFYNENARKVLNLHAPNKSITVSTKRPPKWFSSELITSRRRLRRAERKHRLSRSIEDKNVYLNLRRSHDKMVLYAKKQFVQRFCEENHHNPRLLWTQLNSLIGRVPPLTSPKNIPEETLAQEFLNAFKGKICMARSSLPPSSAITQIPTNHVASCQDPALLDLDTTNEYEMIRIIMESSSSSCSLDPIPTWLLRKSLKSLLPMITLVVNKCLKEGLPAEWKKAIIRPLFKKGASDPEDLNSYRPVSNLPFLSKVVEKVVAERVNSFLQSTDRLNPHQHAYKSLHSCETALITVLDEAYGAIDNGDILLLVLLDLTAAFDLVDHDLLLLRLQGLGINGAALSWFRSYLRDRSQTVICLQSQSPPSKLTCGVPQGSVLGPLLFTLFINDISSIVNNHKDVHHTLYADDTQLYLRTHPDNVFSAITSLENCVASVNQWLKSSLLLLNPKKTEFIILTGKSKVHLSIDVPFNIDGHIIKSKPFVRDLGVILDSTLSFERHILSVRKVAFAYLRILTKIRRFISAAHAAEIAQALVLSRLNYCCSLLHGIPKKQLTKLQAIINYAIRIIDRIPSRQSVTDFLKKRDWLGIDDRIKLRLVSFAYTAAKFNSPRCLSSLIRRPSMNSGMVLRSQTSDQLLVPRTKTTIGDRAFSTAAPKSFNVLPDAIRLAKSLGHFKALTRRHLNSLNH
jgi:hypothetical protein